MRHRKLISALIERRYNHSAWRMGASSADRRCCGPRLFLTIALTVSYSNAVSKLRRPFLSNRYFFITVRLLKRREKLDEPDFILLARALNRARALHPFYLTAWV